MSASQSSTNGPIQMEEAKSSKNIKYQRSVESAGDIAAGKEERSLGKTPFSITVNWPVTTDWVTTSQDVQNTAGITRYKLLANPPPPPVNPPPIYYAYTLWFTNTEHYDYFFTDASPDTYECNTFINRDHFVSYNDDNDSQATIVKVTGA